MFFNSNIINIVNSTKWVLYLIHCPKYYLLETDMNIEKKVKQFISENFLINGDNTTLDSKASLLEKGIIDSTGVLELVSFIETEFKIKIEEDELIPENLDTIENIYNFISRKENS